MNLIAQLKALFRTPSAAALAVQELEEAQRQLLAALTAQEFAASMVAYNTARVNRLSGSLTKVIA